MDKVIIAANSMQIPALGLGTWQLTGNSATKSVLTALETGYRHIDTADNYGNHKEVGKGITESGIPREKLFLTTKVWRTNLNKDTVVDNAKRFCEELQTDYLDLLLIHWPNPEIPLAETLIAMQELRNQGIIKAIGVSNFTIPLLEKALQTGIPFIVNQVEFHPSLYQKDLKAFCDAKQIILTAYSPIGQGRDLKLPLIQELAKQYDKTPAQIILNWILKKRMIVIPRSSNTERIKENFDAQSFVISDADEKRIDEIGGHNRLINPAFGPFSE